MSARAHDGTGRILLARTQTLARVGTGWVYLALAAWLGGAGVRAWWSAPARTELAWPVRAELGLGALLLYFAVSALWRAAA